MVTFCHFFCTVCYTALFSILLPGSPKHGFPILSIKKIIRFVEPRPKKILKNNLSKNIFSPILKKKYITQLFINSAPSNFELLNFKERLKQSNAIYLFTRVIILQKDIFALFSLLFPIFTRENINFVLFSLFVDPIPTKEWKYFIQNFKILSILLFVEKQLLRFQTTIAKIWSNVFGLERFILLFQRILPANTYLVYTPFTSLELIRVNSLARKVKSLYLNLPFLTYCITLLVARGVVNLTSEFATGENPFPYCPVCKKPAETSIYADNPAPQHNHPKPEPSALVAPPVQSIEVIDQQIRQSNLPVKPITSVARNGVDEDLEWELVDLSLFVVSALIVVLGISMWRQHQQGITPGESPADGWRGW